MLSIAINDYPVSDRRLRGCINDSVAWVDWFAKRGWQTESLWNEQATGAKIVSAIAKLMVDSNPGDRVAIHFSGHGSQIQDFNGDEGDGLDECYCPWDVSLNGPIRDDVLYQLFQQRASNVRLYLIADCCHSGSLHRGSGFTRFRYLPLESGSQARSSGRNPAAVRSAGLLLAACGEGERAREITVRGHTQGLLTHLALGAWKQLPSGATHEDWLLAIRARLRPGMQTPRLVGNRLLREEPVFGG
jgi:metacaspase-1